MIQFATKIFKKGTPSFFLKERRIKIMDKNHKLEKKSSNVFAKGLCVDKLFWIFLIASVFGVYYEQILNWITHYLQDGSIYWEIRRGVIYGPLSPIYGIGASLMTYFLLRKKRSMVQTFLFGSIIGGGFEYGMSYLQEIFTGTISWDYSHHFMNIGGRTTIPFMLVWGAFSVLLVRGLYPKISSFIEKIPAQFGTIITKILMLLVCLDCLISLLAVARQTLRHHDISPLTPVDVILDVWYPDEVLEKYYPNMKSMS